MKYYTLLLFLVIFQLEAMNGAKDGKRICDDLLELVDLIGKKKVRQVTAAKPEVSPAAALNSPVAENADCKPFPISESHGIQFQRLRYPSSSRCKYKCLECGTIVTNHRPHAIAHNDIRPYVCVCGKSYKQSGHLMGHKKTCSQALSHKKKTKDLKKTLELFFSETEEEFEEIPESEEEHD